MKKVALHNLGCKVNAYETEAMQEMLEGAGYEIVPFAGGRRYLYHQYLHRDKYRRPQIKTDAAPRPEDESGGGRCGGRLLCAGAGSERGYRSMYRYCDRK